MSYSDLLRAVIANQVGVLPNTHALSFVNASEQEVLIGDIDYNTATAFTIEAWIKTAESGQNRHIFTRDGPLNRFWQFRLDTSGKLRFIRFNSSNGVVANYLSDTDINTGEWVHVCVVFDNSVGSKIYINGNEDATDANTTNNKTGTGEAVTIGGYGRSSNQNWQGSIDDVRLWGVARSESEIQSNMMNQLTGNESGLLGYWKLNEGEGSTALDSAQENHGTLINNPDWITDTPFP